jgi:hypothetical protein
MFKKNHYQIQFYQLRLVFIFRVQNNSYQIHVVFRLDSFSFFRAKMSISNSYCTLWSIVFIFRVQKSISNQHCIRRDKNLIEVKESLYIVVVKITFFFVKMLKIVSVKNRSLYYTWYWCYWSLTKLQNLYWTLQVKHSFKKQFPDFPYNQTPTTGLKSLCWQANVQCWNTSFTYYGQGNIDS